MFFFFSFVFYSEILACFLYVSIGSHTGNGVHPFGNLPARGKSVGENSGFGQSLQLLVMTAKGTGFTNIRGSGILHCPSSDFGGVLGQQAFTRAEERRGREGTKANAGRSVTLLVPVQRCRYGCVSTTPTQHSKAKNLLSPPSNSSCAYLLCLLHQRRHISPISELNQFTEHSIKLK